MRRRWFIRCVVGLGTMSLCGKAAAQPSPTASPVARTLPQIVGDMIDAKNAAAGDVYVVHNYGSTLGMNAQDIAGFEISYVKLQSAANGFLERLGYLVENNDPIDQGDLNLRANAIFNQAKALDDSVATISRNQQRTGTGGERGLDFLKLLQTVVPLLSPIITAVTGVSKAVSDSRKQSQADRKDTADRIRKTYWPDVKTASGTPPNPPKAS